MKPMRACRCPTACGNCTDNNNSINSLVFNALRLYLVHFLRIFQKNG
jgi:hypothetical protein